MEQEKNMRQVRKKARMKTQVLLESAGVSMVTSGITESLQLEKTTGITKSNHQPITTMLPKPRPLLPHLPSS